jgi:hypothetical protein
VASTNFALDGGAPTWRIRVDSPEEYREVEHRNDFRIFYFPGGAVLSWVLDLSTPSSDSLAVHHAFDLSDGPTRDYLSAVAASGKVVLLFEGSEDQKTPISVGTAKLSRLLKQGLDYNGRLSATSGAEAVRKFLELFDPLFRERGAEAAWAEAELAAGIAERPQAGGGGPAKGGTSADLGSQSQTVRGTDRRRKPAAEESSEGTASHHLPFEPLLQAARPDLYLRNAFRIAELPVDVSSRDLDKRQRLVEMAAQTGAAVPPGPLRALPVARAAGADLFRDSITRLRDPGQRIIDELFWFWLPSPGPAGTADPAMAALRESDVKAAIDLWSAKNAEPGTAPVRAHNLAVLYHTLALDSEAAGKDPAAAKAPGVDPRQVWEKAFEHWRAALAEDALWDMLRERIGELNDPRLPTSVSGRIRRTLPKALLSISAQLAVAAAQDGKIAEAERHSRILSKSGFDAASVEEALRGACGPLRDRIAVLSAQAAKETDETPEKGAEIAERLLAQATPLLGGIDALFPAAHFVRASAHDEVAVHALIAAVRFGNVTEGNDEKVLLTLKRLLPLAESQAARGRIEQNIETVTKNIRWAEENKAFLKCWFCKSRAPEKGAEATVDMHANVTQQSAGYRKTRYQWDTRKVSVPRCDRCRAVHKKTDSWGGTGTGIGFFGVAAVFVFLIIQTPKEIGGLGCGGFIASAIAAVVLGGIFKSVSLMLSPADVKREAIKESFPSVLESKKQGWALGAKPPGVS